MSVEVEGSWLDDYKKQLIRVELEKEKNEREEERIREAIRKDPLNNLNQNEKEIVQNVLVNLTLALETQRFEVVVDALKDAAFTLSQYSKDDIMSDFFDMKAEQLEKKQVHKIFFRHSISDDDGVSIQKVLKELFERYNLRYYKNKELFRIMNYNKILKDLIDSLEDIYKYDCNNNEKPGQFKALYMKDRLDGFVHEMEKVYRYDYGVYCKYYDSSWDEHTKIVKEIFESMYWLRNDVYNHKPYGFGDPSDKKSDKRKDEMKILKINFEKLKQVENAKRNEQPKKEGKIIKICEN